MRLTPPPADPDAALLARVGRWRSLAWAALLWERLWPLLLPLVCVAGVFAALALFDVLPLLPGWLHGFVLAAAAGALAALLVRVALHLRLPRDDEAARRLERDSGLDHRPLDALADQPAGAGDDPLAQALWQAHRRHAAARIGALRVALPHPNMAARDPWGLRAAVLLLVVIAGTYGHADWNRRLDRALSPAMGGMGIGPDSVEVWITPPAYTHVAPLLKPDQPAEAQALSVPAGSTVLAVLSGGWGAATLEVDGHGTDFQRQADGSQRIETELQSGHLLAVRQAGLRVASWAIDVVADAVPSIAWEAPPEAGERARLRLALTASDDHGLAKAWVNVRRMGAPPGDDPLVVALPLPGGQPRTAAVSGWFDLTAHPWAGLPVTMQPAVQDALGQVGLGEPVTVTLPERVFTNPVAAAVVEARKRVTEDLAAVPETVALLDGVTVRAELFHDDIKTFLMLRLARHALANDRFDLAEVQDLMWNGALRIEEGDLAGAEQSLEDARQALERAVEEGAPAAELQRLLDQFQQALERYMQAMAAQGETNQVPPMAGAGDTITDDELRQMVQTMRDMAETGSREALKQMLQEMSRILDGLQSGANQQAGGQAGQGLKDLRDLVRRQQDMLDQSHRRSQEGQRPADQGEEAGERPGQDQGGQDQGGQDQKGQGGGKAGQGGGNGGAQAAEAQEALRRALGEAARKLGQGLGGETPGALGEADAAMGDAARDLRRGRWSGAADSQAQALDLMRQAARQALEQMGGSGGVIPRDPLGRPMRSGGTGDDGTTKIPDHSEIQRSRDLLNEIRRRAGQYQRPEPERDYLHRLLRQF